MQNREELRQKERGRSRKIRGKKYNFWKEGVINIVFGSKYRPLERTGC
jgi:hypothetical protein